MSTQYYVRARDVERGAAEWGIKVPKALKDTATTIGRGRGQPYFCVGSSSNGSEFTFLYTSIDFWYKMPMETPLKIVGSEIGPETLGGLMKRCYGDERTRTYRAVHDPASLREILQSAGATV